MVHIKSTSIAVLLGSAAISSAAVLPNVHKPEARDGSVSKRAWKGKLGARGPWRQATDNYLINVDLTGDGEHHNGHGTLLDINTRALAPEQQEVLRRHLKAHMQRTEPVIVIGSGSHEVPADPLLNIEIATGLRERDDRLLDLAARLIIGSGEATNRLAARDSDLAGLEAAAKDAGVTDDQMAAAKSAVDNLTPEQKAEVENAVKHAMFTVARPGEKKRNLPGPAYLFKKSDEAAINMIKQGGKVKVIGDEAAKDTGVGEAGKHGAPLLAQPNSKRSVADEMGGAPGYIDITSPVFNSTATRLASLVLSTSNGTNENSTFVLNASSSVRTQVFLVPLNSTEAGGEPKEGDMIKVNLKVPVFVAESAAVEPFCATFDPSPNAPEPMTVEPCEEPEDERSQIFLFDPETGAVKPNWTPSETNQQLLSKVPDSVSSEGPMPTDWIASSVSSAVASATASASALPSVSVSASLDAPTASLSDVGVMALPTPTDPALASALPTPTDAALEPEATAEPLESGVEDEALPTATEDWATAAAALPTESVEPSAVVSALPSDMPSVIPTPAISSAAEALVTAFAVSHSAAVPSASAVVSHAKSAPASSNAGNNVTLIFTPANASVQSKDDSEDAEPVHAGKSKREHMEDDGDCDDTLSSTHGSGEIFAFADPAAALPAVAPSAHASHSSAPAASSAASKPKPKAPKLAEDAPAPIESAKKVKVVEGDVQVDDVQALAGRLTVRNLKREQKVMMAPATAPYEWTWTSVEEAEKEPEETVKVFAALSSRD
ncbi:uncharacterized protein MKK02DRAFT_45570 [Dioszegia hungarica]|uniref:Uncharacterized protein n=1 Tax=Dioszegia hungarica TaxID=4972 RepID=A0AA38HAP7_9TREE|nr:uncharacterized protein MKK02DRAFT_45570 [Dioszegia hungarica]KAI9636862.1 hypothetical protein MKK02DRAFT_45570 [Dioszegia hungarica]